jgi:hypothetical protein
VEIQTANTILTTAQAELGLPVTSVAATDALTTQLVALLNKAGRELAKLPWSHLVQRTTVTTTAATSYALPSDYGRMVDQSGWDVTGQLPLVGPLSPQEWEALQARSTISSLGTAFRVWLNRLYIYPSTTTGKTLAYEYRSAFWVAGFDGALTAPDEVLVSNNGDLVWFDFQLAVAALKVAWKREKGFDSTSAEQDFQAALEAAMSDDKPAPVLNAGSPSAGGVRMISLANVPDAGFGS